MAEILVLAEHVDEDVKKVTLELITLARRFGEPSVVWTGPGAERGQARCAEYGAARMYVDDGPVAEQSIFGGATIVHSRVSRGTPIVAMRPNAVAPEPEAGAAEISPVSLAGEATGARVTNRVVAERSERPDLTEASIVVSGGRGTGGAEGFGIIETLADPLGAAVGASRAVTDAGWYPHQFQV